MTPYIGSNDQGFNMHQDLGLRAKGVEGAFKEGRDYQHSDSSSSGKGVRGRSFSLFVDRDLQGSILRMFIKLVIWFPVAYYLVVWTGVLSQIQAEETLLGLEDWHIQEVKQFGNNTLPCADNGCISSRGRCGPYWSLGCLSKNSDLCTGFCTCCVPCGGQCGSNNEGLCRASCAWDEYSIDANSQCGSGGCRCCAKNPDCGGRCGANDTYYCRRWYTCPFWHWITGTCTGSSCRCCRI
ncbi:uncharacterized protein [Macrobrachium rosenbergii]|uniref:uncharacterized protein n=1 Tax=Macrobrachium rosenbergii TaxID=79674 RepID=UPI0034D6A7C5